MSLKIHDVKIKNKDGLGNGIGDYLTTVTSLEQMYNYMERYNYKQVYAISECGTVACFYLDEYIKDQGQPQSFFKYI